LFFDLLDFRIRIRTLASKGSETSFFEEFLTSKVEFNEERVLLWLVRVGNLFGSRKNSSSDSSVLLANP